MLRFYFVFFMLLLLTTPPSALRCRSLCPWQRLVAVWLYEIIVFHCVCELFIRNKIQKNTSLFATMYNVGKAFFSDNRMPLKSLLQKDKCTRPPERPSGWADDDNFKKLYFKFFFRNLRIVITYLCFNKEVHYKIFVCLILTKFLCFK